jgi:hypothetical protein
VTSAGSGPGLDLECCTPPLPPSTSWAAAAVAWSPTDAGPTRLRGTPACATVVAQLVERAAVTDRWVHAGAATAGVALAITIAVGAVVSRKTRTAAAR